MLVCRRLVCRALLPTTGHRGIAVRCLGIAHVDFDLCWLTGDVARRACGVHDSLSVRSSLLLIFLQPSRASPLRRIQHSRLTHWRCACRHSLLALGLLRLHLGIPGFQWWLVHAQEVEAYIAVPLEYDGAHSLLLAEL